MGAGGACARGSGCPGTSVCPWGNLAVHVMCVDVECHSGVIGRKEVVRGPSCESGETREWRDREVRRPVGRKREVSQGEDRHSRGPVATLSGGVIYFTDRLHLASPTLVPQVEPRSKLRAATTVLRFCTRAAILLRFAPVLQCYYAPVLQIYAPVQYYVLPHSCCNARRSRRRSTPIHDDLASIARA